MRDWYNLGLVLYQEGKIREARAHVERALRIDEAAHAPHHPHVARDIYNLGRILRAEGDLAEARAHLQRALGVFEKAYGSEHPRTQNCRRHLEELG